MNEKEKNAAAEARNAYARRWRAANPEKVRANNERYWLRRAEREAADKKGLTCNEKGDVTNGGI